MPRNKRNLEKIESIVERSPEFHGPPMEEVSAYLRDRIERALQNPSANPASETRSLSEIVSDIENDKSKSQAREDFEIHIAKVADRLAHRKTVLTVSDNASQPEQANEPLPLHERIKFLRERLN